MLSRIAAAPATLLPALRSSPSSRTLKRSPTSAIGYMQASTLLAPGRETLNLSTGAWFLVSRGFADEA